MEKYNVPVAELRSQLPLNEVTITPAIGNIENFLTTKFLTSIDSVQKLTT